MHSSCSEAGGCADVVGGCTNSCSGEEGIGGEYAEDLPGYTVE